MSDNNSKEHISPPVSKLTQEDAGKLIVYKDLLSPHVLSSPLGYENLLPFSTSEIDAGENGQAVKSENGVLMFDKKALDAAEEKAKFHLKRGIETGNKREVNMFLWYLDRNEEHKGLADQVRDATLRKDSSGLNFAALDLAIPNRTLAERQLIKNALSAQIKMIPIRINDQQVLDPTKLDIVMTQGKNGEFELFISSESGIEKVAVEKEEQLSRDSYKPDYEQIHKEDETIVIPLKDSGSGDAPLASIIKIVKTPVDMPELLYNQKRKAEEEERQKREAERQRNAQPQYPTYSAPTPPSTPRTSSRQNFYFAGESGSRSSSRSAYNSES